MPGGGTQKHLRPSKRVSSPHTTGQLWLKPSLPPASFCAKQTPDLPRRAQKAGRRKAREHVSAIHPEPSHVVAPNCLFVKGPESKLASWYKRTKHARCLKIHPSRCERSPGCLQAAVPTLIVVIGSLFSLSDPASP